LYGISGAMMLQKNMWMVGIHLFPISGWSNNLNFQPRTD